jgi:hypothetical protein
MSLANKIGKACLALATGGMSLNPALAQQGNGANSQPPKGSNAVTRANSPDKEVTLAPDGTFRAAVLTLGGSLVSGANLTISNRQGEPSDAAKSITGTRGLTTVSGLKPGIYKVRIESSHGSYEGSLLIKTAPVSKVSFVPPPLVTFILIPAQPPDQPQDQGRGPGTLILEDLDTGGEVGGVGGGALFPILGLAGGAAAIALPVSLGRHHRASP